MSRLSLRFATSDDVQRLLAWRNEPETRAASRNRDEVTEAEHRSWLAEVLADDDRRLLIAELDGAPIGQVRFDRCHGYHYEISISVEPASRSKGLGSRLLVGSLEWLWLNTSAVSAEAVVRDSNESSRGAFEAAGFRESGAAEEGFVRLLAERPEPWAPETPAARSRRLPFSE